jgi:hypothetical protein
LSDRDIRWWTPNGYNERENKLIVIKAMMGTRVSKTMAMVLPR